MKGTKQVNVCNSLEGKPVEIAERLRAVVSELYGTGYADMERMSGIARGSWRKMLSGGQRPTAEMIEAVCTAHPEMALWIATGIEDEETGQVALGDASTLGKWTGTVLRTRMLERSMRGVFRKPSWLESFLIEMAKLEERGIGRLHKSDQERLERLASDQEEITRQRRQAKKKLAEAMAERMKQLDDQWQSQKQKTDGE